MNLVKKNKDIDNSATHLILQRSDWTFQKVSTQIWLLTGVVHFAFFLGPLYAKLLCFFCVQIQQPSQLSKYIIFNK